ncbi:MAG: hypothetical protein SGILL_008119, partial [Bacillariaceae sp.]
LSAFKGCGLISEVAEQPPTTVSAEAAILASPGGEEQQTGLATTLKNRTNVIVFVTNNRYGQAVAMSIQSLRQDGGYRGDVAVIVQEDAKSRFTVESLQNDILQKGGSLENITFFSTTKLWDDLELSKEHDHFRSAPPAPKCLSAHRAQGHPSYYLKTLIFHPNIADRWDTVMYMDSCMTFESPHVPEILEMSEIQGHLIASPDPWVFGYKMLSGRTVSCVNETALQLAQQYVGQDLGTSSYFTTGLVLYDSQTLVRSYGESSKASILELLQVYHELASVFEGDQLIMSVYWHYIRQAYQIIPYALFGSPRVPYEFIKRMPNEEYIVSAGNSDRPVCKRRPSWEYETGKKVRSIPIEAQSQQRG